MKPFGLDGSTTTHGGIVKATQFTHKTDETPHLREGDGFQCPKCGVWSTLILSNKFIKIHGKYVSFVDDKFTCGAQLLGSDVASPPKGDEIFGASTIMLNSSGMGLTSLLDGISDLFSGKYKLVDEATGEPLKKVKYKITYDDGSVVEGTTNIDGETETLSARKNQNNITIDVVGDESW